MNSQKQYTTEGIPRKNTLQREHCTTEGIQGTIHYRGNSKKHYTTEGTPGNYTTEGTPGNYTTEGTPGNTTLQRELQETLHYIKGNSK